MFMISISALMVVDNVPTYDPPYESCRRNGIGVIKHSLDLYISIELVFLVSLGGRDLVFNLASRASLGWILMLMEIDHVAEHHLIPSDGININCGLSWTQCFMFCLQWLSLRIFLYSFRHVASFLHLPFRSSDSHPAHCDITADLSVRPCSIPNFHCAPRAPTASCLLHQLAGAGQISLS